MMTKNKLKNTAQDSPKQLKREKSFVKASGFTDMYSRNRDLLASKTLKLD